MSGLPFVAPLIVLASLLWAMPPLLFPQRRRVGITIAVSHLIITLAITRPWAEDWYWRDGVWLILVFGHGTLIALGRLGFELSPLGTRHLRPASRLSAHDEITGLKAKAHPSQSG
ncbi:hypothetical protein [Streptomyces chartreusis]|uniref:hypothetical protein n=1 Tax=Streptomyces chartreusis TaxID=1969 RepID=UPI00382FF021